MSKELLPTEADVRFYQKNGYWIGPKVVPDELIQRMHAHMDAVFAGDYETGREPVRYWHPGDSPAAVRKIDFAWWADETIRELAFSEQIGAIAATLAQTPAVRLWHDQLLYKPPSGDEAGNVGWHQDYQYWQCTKPADMLTAWVALVDVDETNGCMQFLPGSHRLGLVEEGLNFFDSKRDSQLEQMKRRADVREPVSAVMKAGQVSFHHCLTVHGSGPNFSSGPRRSLVMHLLPDHIRRNVGSPNDEHRCCSHFAGGDNDLWRGAHFPVVYAEPGYVDSSATLAQADQPQRT